MKLAVYKEEGWVGLVEVLSDNSDDKFIAYSIKVLRTICNTGVFPNFADGRIFNISIARDFCGYSLWELFMLENSDTDKFSNLESATLSEQELTDIISKLSGNFIYSESPESYFNYS